MQICSWLDLHGATIRRAIKRRAREEGAGQSNVTRRDQHTQQWMEPPRAAAARRSNTFVVVQPVPGACKVAPPPLHSPLPTRSWCSSQVS